MNRPFNQLWILSEPRYKFVDAHKRRYVYHKEDQWFVQLRGGASYPEAGRKIYSGDGELFSVEDVSVKSRTEVVVKLKGFRCWKNVKA